MATQDYSAELHKKWLEARDEIDALTAENEHLRQQLAACKQIASDALDGDFSRYRAELAKIAQIRV